MRVLMALVTVLGVGVAREPAAPVEVLILSGRNNHDWRTTTPHLRQLLEQTGQFRVRVTEEPAGLTGEILKNYQALVVDYNGVRWGAVAEQAVEEFVRKGGGMVVVHAASYAFGEMEVLGDNHARTGIREAPWQEWAKMVGARWREKPPKSGHGQRHCFEVRWVDVAHPIAGGGEPFVTCDELYHQLVMEPGAHVLATAFDRVDKGGTGRDEPLLWTVQYGAGRVFHTALGHDVAAMQAPGFVASFRRGVAWAAGGVPAMALAAAPVRALVVTGGHDHDPAFYSIFDNEPGIAATVNPHPTAYRGDMQKRVDVLVLYDMVQEVAEEQKQRLEAFVEAGKGVVVLHHAIASFNNWEWWWREVVGGRYLLKPDGGQAASTYKHDVELNATPVGEHPITRGVPPMRIFDETYKGMWISPKVKVLMTTDEATSDGPLVWVSPYEKSRVVYIQLGHGREAHVHPGYRKLVTNAIRWAAGRQ